MELGRLHSVNGLFFSWVISMRLWYPQCISFAARIKPCGIKQGMWLLSYDNWLNRMHAFPQIDDAYMRHSASVSYSAG